MTYRRYVRLCAVLFVPLLLLGIVIFKFAIPYPRYTNIICEGGGVLSENCRYVGNSDGGLYSAIKKSRPIWVDVTVGEFDEGNYLQTNVEVTGRIIRSARIVDAQPFAAQSDEVGAYMKTLVGVPATVMLGIENNERSMIADGAALLACNGLNIKDEAGLYSANCYGSGWSGPITFRADGEGRNSLETLRTKIGEEIRGLESDYLLYRILTYPLFIYLFLILSLVSWLVVQSFRFVRRG